MKKMLKDIGCSVLFEAGILQLLKFNTRILAYHTVNPKYFEKQMLYLKKNYEVVSLQDALKNLDRMQAVITFDDGYKNNYLQAYPILKKLGLKATMYITYEFADKNLFAWWDRVEYSKKGHSLRGLKSTSYAKLENKVFQITGLKSTDNKPEEYDFMSWREINQSTDVFEIGSHTLTHTILTNISHKEAEEEIMDSKKKIEKKIGRKIRAFAYPNGNCSDEIIRLVEKAGYSCAVLYDYRKRKTNNSTTNPFKLHRRGINVEDNLAAFACKVAGVL